MNLIQHSRKTDHEASDGLSCRQQVSGNVAQNSEGLFLAKRLQGGASDVALRSYIEHEYRRYSGLCKRL